MPIADSIAIAGNITKAILGTREASKAFAIIVTKIIKNKIKTSFFPLILLIKWN